MIRVGDKVTQIDDARWGDSMGRDVPGSQTPEFGVVYTVRETYSTPHGGVSLLFEEISNPQILTPIGGERGFPAKCFRKVTEPKREFSIEIFRKIDRDVFAKEPAQ